ncbi:hypothetical protein I5M27_17895 [Adhaeribacter sp. BT258]|uniref:Lipoprotein n=1 Tax=Adhaeribacter terrigena TaxID=2793070 RepID=A0ABS1C666_9BACT|nr:hypothetical protein [Adhaeribacter terrigena]MBK0404869.1 hypothetical protein [Adhaeribacter terrigena]
METAGKLFEKLLKLPAVGALGFCFVLACSTVKEQGEPEITAAPTEITNDVQRQIIYEQGSERTIRQNANPIPTGDQLQLNEKASEINRKKNIEEGSNPNAPSNTPTEERPRQMRNVGNDTIAR